MSGSTPKRPQILLSNDDGFQAPGIVALYQVLCAFADVTVIAPEHNNSAKSNSLTLNAPLYVSEAQHGPVKGFKFINGTPADCVHIALTGMLDAKPDMVVSGINNGANMGDDTIYSGTVGAAMEGFLFGVPAVAFSQVAKGWGHLDAAADRAGRIVQALWADVQAGAVDLPFLHTVNIPNLPAADLKSTVVARLGRRHAAEKVFKQTNPRGETMYWIGGAGMAKDGGAGTDFHATAQGHVSLVPLNVDLTLHAGLDTWRSRCSAWQNA